MLDSRIIDLSLNKIFLKLILGEEIPLTIENLRVRRYLSIRWHNAEVDPSALTLNWLHL
jgi:hypothetical protein